MKKQKKIKSEINKSVDPSSINLQHLIKSYSIDKGVKAPAFSRIKNTLCRELNKKLQDDIINLTLAPEESICCKTLKNKDFVIYKDKDLMVLQSPNLAKIQLKLGDKIILRLF